MAAAEIVNINFFIDESSVKYITFSLFCAFSLRSLCSPPCQNLKKLLILTYTDGLPEPLKNSIHQASVFVAKLRKTGQEDFL